MELGLIGNLCWFEEEISEERISHVVKYGRHSLHGKLRKLCEIADFSEFHCTRYCYRPASPKKCLLIGLFVGRERESDDD